VVAHDRLLFWTEVDAEERDAERKAGLTEDVAEYNVQVVEREREVEDDIDVGEAETRGLARLAGAGGWIKDDAKAAEGKLDHDDNIARGEVEGNAGINKAKIQCLVEQAEDEEEEAVN
jgi:hypothetical protein